jgi:hypothetical protein
VTSGVLLPESVYDVLVNSLLEPTDRVIARLNKFQPHRLVGYSSTIHALAQLTRQGKLAIKPQTIVVSGDLMTKSMEREIREAWGAALYSLYSTSESIFLAIREPGQEEMTIIDDLNIVEVLDDEDREVGTGEPGRVVLSNLYNYTMPLLRYELGDYVVRGNKGSGASSSTLREIKGRVNDALPVVTGQGKLDTIHPIVLAEFYAAGVEKVQFISYRPDYIRIDYTARDHIDGEIRREFQRILDMKGASRTAFEVRRVEHVCNDPETGKLRLVKMEGPPAAYPLMSAVESSHQREPASGQKTPATGATFASPRTPNEETLAGIWAEALGVRRVGINHKFSDLGGSSFVAAQIASMVFGAFHIRISAQDFLEAPTVASMASVIIQRQAEAAEPETLGDELAELAQLSEEEAERLLAQELRRPTVTSNEKGKNR